MRNFVVVCLAISWSTFLLGCGNDKENPYCPDSVPPGSLNDLTFRYNPNYWAFSWTAPGDNGGYGIADHYEVRYGFNELSSDSLWVLAHPIDLHLNNHYDPGSLISAYYFFWDQGEPTPNRNYFFGFRYFDSSGNSSPIASVRVRSQPELVSTFTANVEELVASDSQGCLYLYRPRPDGGVVNKYNDDDTLVESWDAGPAEYVGRGGIAVDNQGYVYISTGYSVRKISSAGETVHEWGESGEQVGQIRNGAGIAIDRTFSQVVLADSGNRRIQRFTLDGEFVDSWVVDCGSGTGGHFLMDVAVDSLGQVYSLGTGAFRVQVFDRNGFHLRSWGLDGEENENIPWPSNAIAVDEGGSVCVASNDGLRFFSDDGRLLTAAWVNGRVDVCTAGRGAFNALSYFNGAGYSQISRFFFESSGIN